MPRFVKNGPVIPDRLVQDLEADRVVIFCGAGISMGAGLPDYAGLVRYCYEETGRPLPPKKSTEWLWPDRMLGELEGMSGAAVVRRHVADRLLQPARDLDLHRAILRLAQLRRSDGLRLVTTNFDRYFEDARIGLTLGVDYHSGPILPIPRNDHSLSWKSIVYLHGRLNEAAASNDHLVLSSADFGRAYLTDAWAARFVARLFADFTVLFVGYSLNDPVLRYMTDAFAAENATSMAAHKGGPAYIFVPYRGRAPNEEPYNRRNLQPIFYDQYRRHSRLKKTLIAWAEARDNYLANTTRLIGAIAPYAPNSLSPSDVANLLWAVVGRVDDNGHGAQAFAQVPTRPPIEWMDELERRESCAITAYSEAVQQARQARVLLPERPVSTLDNLFPKASERAPHLLGVAEHGLIDWLLRHLDTLGFVERVIDRFSNGRRLHPAFRARIRAKLATAAFADGFMRFWRIASSEGDWSLVDKDGIRLFNVQRLLDGPHDQVHVKQELLDSLKPILRLQRSYYVDLEPRDENAPPRGKRLAEIADAEVVLVSEDMLEHAATQIAQHSGGAAFWASLVPELTQLLRNVLELYAIAGAAHPDDDPSLYQRPSILPHPQNRHRKRWTLLIDLIWQGWMHLNDADPARAAHHINSWSTIPYLVFKRLTLAAAAQSSLLTPRQKLEILRDV
jgi:hypothetical protein